MGFEAREPGRRQSRVRGAKPRRIDADRCRVDTIGPVRVAMLDEVAHGIGHFLGRRVLDDIARTLEVEEELGEEPYRRNEISRKALLPDRLPIWASTSRPAKSMKTSLSSPVLRQSTNPPWNRPIISGAISASPVTST
jgi:hypothetical protein